MTPAARASLEHPDAPPAKPGKAATWLSSHSLVYAFLTSHAISIPKLTAKPKPTEVELLGRYKTTDGRYYFSQFFSPVYSSRHAIERANRALERAGELGKQAGIPIVLVNNGLPMDSRWMNSREPIVYQDLSDYLGESPVDFFFRNNLGWDGHPSLKGTKKIAEALRGMVGCLGYVRGAMSPRVAIAPPAGHSLMQIGAARCGNSGTILKPAASNLSTLTMARSISINFAASTKSSEAFFPRACFRVRWPGARTCSFPAAGRLRFPSRAHCRVQRI